MVGQVLLNSKARFSLVYFFTTTLDFHWSISPSQSKIFIGLIQIFSRTEVFNGQKWDILCKMLVKAGKYKMR